MIYSIDNQTWQPISFPTGLFSATTAINAIAQSPTRFIAAGSTTPTNNTLRLFYSLNGINWNVTPVTINSVPTVVRDLSYINGKFYSVGSTGTTAMISSSVDGITWTGSTAVNAIVGQPVYSIASNGSRLVVGSTLGAKQSMAYSDNDGLTWSATTNGNSFGQARVSNVIWDGSKFLAGLLNTTGGTKVILSTDGITWTGSSLTELDLYSVEQIAFNGSRYVAVGGTLSGTGSTVYHSDNGGYDWTPAPSSSGFTLINSVAWNGSMFVIGGSSVTNDLGYSYDGITWEVYSDQTLLNSYNYVLSKPNYIQ
jgi:hypothetical protein